MTHMGCTHGVDTLLTPVDSTMFVDIAYTIDLTINCGNSLLTLAQSEIIFWENLIDQTVGAIKYFKL